jgi:hypothetical protein
MFAFLRSRRAPRGCETGLTVVDAPLLDTLADAHATALAEADASFTPERAAAQRAAIVARLGASADSRVLSFPPRALDGAEAAVRHPASGRAGSPRPALGWMLTAAAAGLVVGVGTGQGLYQLQPWDLASGGTAPAQNRSTTTAADAAAGSDADDAILRDVEVALAERGVDELQPLDALTPRVTLVASR